MEIVRRSCLIKLFAVRDWEFDNIESCIDVDHVNINNDIVGQWKGAVSSSHDQRERD